METVDTQEGIATEQARKLRSKFWLWVTLLGLLFSIGAWCFSVLWNIQHGDRASLYISNARQIVLSLMLYGEDSEQSAETLEGGLRRAGFGDADIARLVWIRAEPSGERKRWLYFPESAQKEDGREPRAVLVSPVFSPGNAPPGLTRKRIVAMSDTSVQVAHPSWEVLLSDGRRVKLAELK